ncbi:MAG: hypothetical protein CME31_08140 [Gimesia sp.]|nr:hypothetical protein [Gimesia sp.]|tara:strand:- start:1449 stop:2741 length:1293 start_codon:yes stop_codon:yes gene_type:complete
MGFFKKIFKGVKKVFKEVGRGIKKVVKGVGKFMNKIGIVGQIALMFIPFGQLLGPIFQTMGGWAATALQAMGPLGNSILRGAQFVIGKAGAFVAGAKNTFGTITGGIKTFFGEFTKTALNKIGFDPTKFGFKSATEGGQFASWLETGKGTFGEAWEVVQDNIVTNADKILDPWRNSLFGDSKTTLEGLSDSTYHSVADLKKMNPQITDWKDLDKKFINLDMDNIPHSMIAPRTATAEDWNKFITKGREAAAVDYGMLPESVTGGSVTPYRAQSLLNRDVIRPTAESAARFAEEGKFLEGLGSTVEPTVENWTKFNEKLATERAAAAAARSSGTGFFNIPSAGEAVGEFGKQLAVSTAMDAAKSWIAGDPPEAPQMGYIPDILPAATIGRTAPLQFDFSMPSGWTDGYGRDSTGMYNGQNTYAAYMQKMMG